MSYQGDSSLAVPNYQIIRLLGSGGMGQVYEAEHVVLKNRVAIKILRTHLVETSAVIRFQQEAQAASRLKHENVVWVYDCGISQQGEPYMIMEMIEGETLDLVLKRGPLSIGESLKIFRQICAGVQCAHENGILHRDLKPSNIILENQGRKRVARVLDFGIAKILEDDNNHLVHTHTGDFFGTPIYMSPEQTEGKKLDQRSDIYSMGCILYEMLTGKPPVAGTTAVEIFYKRANETPQTLSAAAGGQKFPAILEKIVARSLAREPGDRFSSANEMVTALDDFDTARPLSLAATISAKGSRANSNVVAITAASVLALVALAIFTFQLIRQPHTVSSDPPKQVAQTDDQYFEKKLSATNQNTKEIDIPKNITDQSLSRLKEFSKLRAVDLSNCLHITEYGLFQLSDLEKLSSLNLANTKLGNGAIKTINSMSKLTKLDLAGTEINNQGLTKLGNLPLESLNLENIKINNQGLKNFKRFHSLSTLSLNGCTKVGDDGVHELEGLQLKTLCLDETNVSDALFFSIQKMPELTHLSLAHVHNISWVFLNETIEKNAMPELTELNLTGCDQIPQELINRFLEKRQGRCTVKVKGDP